MSAATTVAIRARTALFLRGTARDFECGGSHAHHHVTSPASIHRNLCRPMVESASPGWHRPTPSTCLLARRLLLLLLHQPLLVRRGELRPVNGQRDLVDLPGERERHLVVPVIDR